jgi:hypothetical protein
MLFVLLGDGGVREDLGFAKAPYESANWIVQVPPRHDHQQACRVAEASKEVVREVLSRTDLLSVSALPLIGSSTIPMSNPWPVIWPSTHAGVLPADLAGVIAESRRYMDEVARRLSPEPQPRVAPPKLGSWFKEMSRRVIDELMFGDEYDLHIEHRCERRNVARSE